MLVRGERLVTMAARVYLAYGWAMMATSFIMVLATQTVASLSGLSDGQYSVLVATNGYGENFLELVLEILAVPAVVSALHRYVTEAKARA